MNMSLKLHRKGKYSMADAHRIDMKSPSKIIVFDKRDSPNKQCSKGKIFTPDTLTVQQPEAPQPGNNRTRKCSDAVDFGNEYRKTNYSFLKERVYLLSSLIGDRQLPHNRIKGRIGLILWIINIFLHFSFDFYEAATFFHVSWASSIGVFFVMFVICTIFLIRHTVKWFVKITKKLSKEKIYDDTIKRLLLFFKYSPFIMFALSVMGAAGQYGCYAYDDALTLKLVSEGNGTSRNLVPFQVEVILNIVRFTSLTHIYYMMYLLLVFTMVIFFTIVHSQNAFNRNMANELRAHPPPMTFQDAVDKFAMRTKLLRGASENTTVIFSTLLVATSISFVVNAYNFLFIKRYAIYIWFAIAPLIWTVTILVGAALVTSSFQKLKLIAMQSWVEIPEKYDELWSRAQPAQKPLRAKGPDWKASLENMRRRIENTKSEVNQKSEKYEFRDVTAIENSLSINNMTGTKIPKVIIYPALESRHRNDEQNSSQSISIENLKNIDGELKQQNEYYSSVQSGASDITDMQDDKRVTENYTDISLQEHRANKINSSPVPNSYSSDANANEQLRLQDLESLKTSTPMKSIIGSNVKHSLARLQKSLRRKKDGEKERPRSSLSANKSMRDIVRVARSVNKFKNNIPTNKRKFNYEKYIKFLELTLDTVGFSLGKMTITWDRVSFFMVLLLTLVGVFAQNAFLK